MPIAPYLNRYPKLSRQATSIVAGIFAILLLVGAGWQVSLLKVVERMELSLLDFRLKARSEILTPSDQIIVAAMDRQSQDEARNHPELGLYSRVLPRRELAKVINFIADQGAKAIILDLSFESPQTPEDDRALTEAIRNAKNVYVAASMELPLKEYQARQQSLSPERVQLDRAMAFNNYQLAPYLRKQAEKERWMATGCLPAYDTLGVDGLSRFFPSLPIPDSFLKKVWAHQCELASVRPKIINQAALGLAEQGTVPAAHEPWNPLDLFYRQQCLTQMYQQVFARNPDYLSLLGEKDFPLIQDETSTLPAYCLTSSMMEPILAASRGLGITSVDYDQDSIIREVPLFYQGYQGKSYAYLGLRPALDMLPSPPELSGQTLLWGSRVLPLMREGGVILNWRSPRRLAERITRNEHQTIPVAERARISPEEGNRALGYGHLYRTVSVIDIFKTLRSDGRPMETPSLYNLYGQPQSGRMSFKDKIVVYGDAIEDVHRTPVANRIYGPEIVATALDMFLNDRVFVQKVPNALAWLITIGAGAVLFFCPLVSSRLWFGFLGGMAFLGLFCVLNIVVFLYTGYWFPLVVPGLCSAVALTGGVLYRYAVKDREKRQLTHIFAKYVSPQVMQEIVTNPEACLDSLGGAEKNLTVLFADLKGFTERFNNEDPQRMLTQLNEFFTVMTRIILKHQGTYDKYIGDAIMAFFGAPAEFSDHAARACAAALEMQQELEQLNHQWRMAGIPPLQMGIGLSSGKMIVGNFGSEDLQNFTVMGNAVNLGSRLESLTRKVNAPIVISQNTAEQAQGAFAVRDLGLHEIKGFAEPVPAFALDAATGNF
jgi:class 3 adenylate cyclase/CHASE2 domain-containing sensor protein